MPLRSNPSLPPGVKGVNYHEVMKLKESITTARIGLLPDILDLLDLCKQAARLLLLPHFAERFCEYGTESFTVSAYLEVGTNKTQILVCSTACS